MGAQGNFLFLKVVSSQFRFAVGHLRSGCGAWLQCPSRPLLVIWCELCQALGQTFGCVISVHTTYVKQMWLSHFTREFIELHSVFAQGHSVRHRTKIQAWGFLSFQLIQSLMVGSQEI